MKKQLIIIMLAVLVVIISSIYLFIPSQMDFKYNVITNCTENAAKRLITHPSSWKYWWPGQQKDNDVFTYKQLELHIDTVFYNGFESFVPGREFFFHVYAEVFSSTDSTSMFSWSIAATLSNNPFKRIGQYFQVRQLKENIEELTNKVKLYFDKTELVYGFTPVEEKVKDSSLIVVKQVYDHPPSANEIYTIISSINAYIKGKGGKETNYPMLNVQQEDSTVFKVMVAVPVNKNLPSEKNFQLKKMFLGNIIKADVRGGIYTVKAAEEQLKNYVTDYGKESPAIPFQSLVTDRLKEIDTSKWITRLYYPVY